MRQRSRFVRGKENVQPAKIASRSESQSISMEKMPWKNPLKGDETKMAMAEVTIKSAGLYVGFHVKF
ncbi:MAG: hypothetical protein WC956_02325 [bacterium]